MPVPQFRRFEYFWERLVDNAGWTAGGGLEYMLTSNWSVAARYLYVDLGKVSYRTIDQSLLFPTFFENLSVKTKLNLATHWPFSAQPWQAVVQ
jgi:long-subunit fatty acid transport protein